MRECFSLSGAAARYLLRGQAQEEITGQLRSVLYHMLVRLLLAVAAAGMHTVLLWLMNDRLLLSAASV